jgi:hypothetical protein
VALPAILRHSHMGSATLQRRVSRFNPAVEDARSACSLACSKMTGSAYSVVVLVER